MRVPSVPCCRSHFQVSAFIDTARDVTRVANCAIQPSQSKPV